MLQDLLSELDAYFRLSWTFAGLIAASAVLLMLLYIRKRWVERQKEQSAEVSLLVIQGQEEERRRIAGELHDVVLPELQRLAQALRAGERGALERQQTISAVIRELCTRLLPPDFGRLSFRDILLSLCASFSRHGVIEFKAALDNDLDLGRLDAGNQLAIYRIVQEALTNCEKHARGPVVLVTRNRSVNREKRLLICVSDHGDGLLPARSSPGLGLRIMRLRAASLGASLDFLSESGNGLMVRLEVPLNRVCP
ncbi:MAG: hypothetical protein LBU19_11390 [Treponema sp.]|jgi:two-component system NarL family sensor kinase|nr:hypothetical protein [Treponema sp.]